MTIKEDFSILDYPGENNNTKNNYSFLYSNLNNMNFQII